MRRTVHPSKVLGTLVVVLVGVAAACTAVTDTTATSTAPPTNRVECSGVIDSSDQPIFSHLVLDVLALPAQPLDLGRDGEPGTPYEGLRFAKFGLVVSADRAVTLEIVDVQPGTATMEWIPLEDPTGPGTRLYVGPCSGDGSKWIVFSGGLWVSDEPTCVTLAVTADGRTEQARLGVEAACP